MEEDYDALEAEAEAELAALAAEAAAAAQGAGGRSEDGGVVMLPVSPHSSCIASLPHAFDVFPAQKTCLLSAIPGPTLRRPAKGGIGLCKVAQVVGSLRAELACRGLLEARATRT